MIVPMLKQYEPEFLFIVPWGTNVLTEEGGTHLLVSQHGLLALFRRYSRRPLQLCKGKIVTILEGGVPGRACADRFCESRACLSTIGFRLVDMGSKKEEIISYSDWYAYAKLLKSEFSKILESLNLPSLESRRLSRDSIDRCGPVTRSLAPKCSYRWAPRSCLSPPAAQEYPCRDERRGRTGRRRRFCPVWAGCSCAPPKVVAMPLETGDACADRTARGHGEQGQSVQNNTAASVRVAASNGAAQAAPAAPGATTRADTWSVGDTAPAIAQKLLGNANRWQELMAYNRIADPNSLVVGQRLLLPAAAGAVRVSRTAPARMAAAAAAPAQVALARPAVAPAPVVRAPVRASAAAQEFEAVEPELDSAPTVNAPQRVSAPAVAQAKKTAGTAGFDADASYYGQSGGTYIVQKGDTLGKIAKKLLGSSKRWREIAGANPQINPNRLEAGMSLSIPGMEPPAQVAAAQSFDAGGQTAIPAYEPPPMAPPPPSFSAPPSAMMPPAPPAPVMPQEMEPPPPPPYEHRCDSTGAHHGSSGRQGLMPLPRSIAKKKLPDS